MKNLLKNKTVLVILAAIVILIIIFVSHKSAGGSAQSTQASDNSSTLQSISKLMLIPNEQPIIATINQADVLTKEQAFYVGSQNGDKLVIFPQAAKAIIYSPSRNIIVNAGPFVLNSSTTKNLAVPTHTK